jgi:hypothetical protein
VTLPAATVVAAVWTLNSLRVTGPGDAAGVATAVVDEVVNAEPGAVGALEPHPMLIRLKSTASVASAHLTVQLSKRIALCPTWHAPLAE